MTSTMVGIQSQFIRASEPAASWAIAAHRRRTSARKTPRNINGEFCARLLVPKIPANSARNRSKKNVTKSACCRLRQVTAQSSASEKKGKERTGRGIFAGAQYGASPAKARRSWGFRAEIAARRNFARRELAGRDDPRKTILGAPEKPAGGYGCKFQTLKA